MILKNGEKKHYYSSIAAKMLVNQKLNLGKKRCNEIEVVENFQKNSQRQVFEKKGRRRLDDFLLRKKRFEKNLWLQKF